MNGQNHPQLSEAQLEVLADPSARILVAAGAGSGKTRLLVAYFAQALLKEGLPLENLAAVTFTRKAGSELSMRIRRELEQSGHPELARDIDRAIIGTIHGLCARLLRDRPLQAGVDPYFGIIEDDVASLVREEVSRQAWNQVIEEATGRELDAIISRGDSLRTQAVALYVRLRSMGQGMPQMSITSALDEPAAREALLVACRQALAEVPARCRRGSTIDDGLEKVGLLVEWLDLAAAGAERPVVARANALFPRRGTAAEPWFAAVRDALIEYRCALAEDELRPAVVVMNRLLALLHERYSVYKDSRGVLDFADLELRATVLVAANAGPSRGPAAESPSGSAAAPALGSSAESPLRPAAFVSRMLVDEFQDTNEVQCALLDRMGADRVLMVGDERQSIYGFRGADVDVFRRRKGAKDLGQHPLQTNYRSRPELLDFVNRVFSSDGFFGSETFDPLRAGRDLKSNPPVGLGPGGPWVTEVLVAERPVAAEGQEEAPVFHEAEARAVATRIRRLIDEEGFAQEDIVVLLPVLSNVSLFQEALHAEGIDIYVVRGKGYYSQEEVADVAALLKILLNPHDDLALVTVLRSPLVGVSDDCLYLVGRAARSARARSLWEMVRRGQVADLSPDDQEKLECFTRHLDALRARVGRPGLSELIDQAVTCCDYDLCLLAAPEGKRRFANVRKLMRMAADFEALEGPDLAGFVALIGSLNELGDTEGNAPSLAEGEDVVRVMTVHQAKGLEFPAVFLAGLGSPGQTSKADEFVVGHDGQMAALVKERNTTYEEFHPHWGPAPQILADQRRREQEEDVRLLYVAMTRAKDRLFLVGARPRTDKVGTTPIGRIVAALGLDCFPDPGTVVDVGDIRAVVMGVPYSEAEKALEDVAVENASVENEHPARVVSVGQAPQPQCFLELAKREAVPREISFSALAAFDRCPRQFYLERTLGLGALAKPMATDDDQDMAAPDSLLRDEESDAGRDVGLLVHSLLEQIDLRGERPSTKALYGLAHASAVDARLTLNEGGIKRAVDLVCAFWDSPLAGDPDMDLALREEAFFFVHQGLAVHGVMDLLCQGEHQWRIVDYKSNSLGRRTPEEIARGYALQADVYCLAALKAGAPRAHMEFLFLERPEQPVVLEYGPEDQQRLEGRLDEALAGIKEGTFPPVVGPNCDECGVANLCRPMARL